MPSYAITGAARGLGLELVKQLSSNPSNTIFGIVRNPDNAISLASLAKLNPNVHIIEADVGNPELLASAATAVSKLTGGVLDILIHNAAATDLATLSLPPSQLPVDAELLHKAFKDTLDTSVFGAIMVTNAFLPLVRRGNEKKIVHISSGMAEIDLIKKTGISYGVAYSAGKAALNVIVAKYAAELAPESIKVLALSPGWVDTYEGPIPIPRELRDATEKMLQEFQKVEPNLKGQLSKEESVRDQIDVIQNKLDMSLSGAFVSHHGNSHWF
ncbi:hypothetical protein BGW36DRAFT_288702 [Talaromyces proteolyticus]|uniref:NAD(P)-binding protein n=1 Tax=Talaromyces proteolyticus TaxID=1131652 RepID=A0AAD4L3D4_9EURO|nr:uncharacterized protein BGW36DRAFT_288702 [Talaromyces proteolyticus]KAH8703869.1 hypothetical protein BGW36DRAFT_288702 [Talaromyces proteolyticus]